MRATGFESRVTMTSPVVARTRSASGHRWRMSRTDMRVMAAGLTCFTERAKPTGCLARAAHCPSPPKRRETAQAGSGRAAHRPACLERCRESVDRSAPPGLRCLPNTNAQGGLAMGAAVHLQSAVERFVAAPVRKMLIDGKWVEAASGKTFETINPATGQVLARVAEGDKEDIDRAARAARRTFDDGRWARLNPGERQRLLLKIADLIDANGDELAQLETLDNGKPFTESRHVDIPAAAETFRYYAGWVTKIYGETNPSDAAFFNFTLREPVGVCGQIIPWNFPLLMCAWKLAPALACGNTCVLKPAEQTPLTALRLGELLLEAGVPAGVVNIVPGFGPTAGGALVRHPMVDKIAFTGSTEVGKEIHRETSSTLKRVSLELGGKSPNIVFSDADMDAAVQGALLGVFFCAGQVCCAGTRLFVEQKTHDEFADKLAKTAAGMKQGPGLDPETRIGPLVSQEQLERVTGYLEVGRRRGR